MLRHGRDGRKWGTSVVSRLETRRMFAFGKPRERAVALHLAHTQIDLAAAWSRGIPFLE
jgi:hypothetical protein